MILRSQIRALRGDDAPQRSAQAAAGAVIAAWSRSAPARAINADLACYAAGRSLADLPRLNALFAADRPEAAMLAADRVAPLLAVLAAHPLAQVPLRHFCDERQAVLVVARQAGAMLRSMR